MDEVREHEDTLVQYALERLATRDHVEVHGPSIGEERTGVVAFNVNGIHGHDLSSILNDNGIAVRAGDHCTQPLHDILEIPGSVRASFYVYNTTDEIDRLIDAVDGSSDALVEYLASDRYHDRILEHDEDPCGAGALADSTFTKHSEETSCGDDGEFHIKVSSDGIIERLVFESESCAVSSAVASILTKYLEGGPLKVAIELDGDVADLLEDTFPALTRDCVVGPEDVIREGAEEYIEAQ